jgi:hydrogenase expression/formation protein HypC
MCLGIPMIIEATDGITATCLGRGEQRTVSLLVVGEQPVGTWVLVHIDTAVRALDPAEVPLLNDALDALEAVNRGDPFEHLFADLINREPQLPDHLKPNAKEQA